MSGRPVTIFTLGGTIAMVRGDGGGAVPAMDADALCAAVPELEALRRWAMTLHNQYPWDRSQARLTAVSNLRDDDVVVVFHPRTRAVLER